MYLTIIFFEIGNILYYFSIAEWFNMIFFLIYMFPKLIFYLSFSLFSSFSSILIATFLHFTCMSFFGLHC